MAHAFNNTTQMSHTPLLATLPFTSCSHMKHAFAKRGKL